MTFQPDQLIDRALQSLRDTHPPTGLEARVAARLAQAGDARAITSSSRASSHSSFAETSSCASFFAVILSIAKEPRILLTLVPLSTLAATALLAITLIAINHDHKPTTTAQSSALPITNPTQPSNPAKTLNPAKDFGLATTLVPQGFSLGSHRFQKKDGALAPAASTDLDTLALAETLAPSHPAPPMPLTAQEHLLALAARQGQPMELAELETLRKPAIEAAAEAHQNAAIRRYAQSLLGPLAAADALNSTSPSPDDTSTPQPPSSK
jgi:hypothetical protein